MSADNEIAVLQCEDQCRVAHCSTSHVWGLNADMPRPSSMQRRIMREAFADTDAQVFTDREAAETEAHRQCDAMEYVEYGVQVYRTGVPWSSIVRDES